MIYNMNGTQAKQTVKGGEKQVSPEVTIYTDGSCRGQGLESARSGWAFVVSGDRTERHIGKVPGQVHDSNRAEVYALLEAMRWADQHPDYVLNVCSDSSLLLCGIRSKKGRQLNPDLWQEIGERLEANRHRIRSMTWIPSQDNPADGLAKEAAIAFVLLDEEGRNIEFDVTPRLAN